MLRDRVERSRIEQVPRERIYVERLPDWQISPVSTTDSAAHMEAWASAPRGAAATTDKSNKIDGWMGEMNLQNMLDGADASPLDLQKLQEYIELLQAKAQQFETIGNEQVPSRYQILYRIQRKERIEHRKRPSIREDRYSLPYFDHPEWVKGQENASRVQCSLPLRNFNLYLEKNKDVAFIVYRNFDADSTSSVTKQGITDATSGRPAHFLQHTSEIIRSVNRDLIEAIKNFLGSQEEYTELLREYSISYELPAPYLFIYHSRKSLEGFQSSLPLPAKAQLSLLLSYVTEQYADDYAAADSLLSQNKILPEYIRYLFKPGDLLLSHIGGQYRGHVAMTWPRISGIKKLSRMGVTAFQSGAGVPLYGSQGATTRMATEKVTVLVCDKETWYWAFDGNFQRQYETLSLQIPAVGDKGMNAIDGNDKNRNETKDKEHWPESIGKDLSELNVFPIQYASAEIVNKCRRRGKTFWKCRNRRYVSYQDNEMESIQNLVSAFMINSPIKRHFN